MIIRTFEARCFNCFVGGEEFLLEGEEGGFGDKRCR